MAELEYLFATSLHRKLKDEIVGKVFVSITRQDELLVEIQSFDNMVFTLKIEGWSTKIIYGYSADKAKSEILKSYKKYIIEKALNKYFK